MVKIVKQYNKDFTLVHNTIFKINNELPEDKQLSFRAMGIFMYLWHLPDDWNFMESELIKHGRENIAAFSKGRKELERLGFVKKTRGRDDKGRLTDYKWILYDNPNLENLKQVNNPTLDYPILEKPKQEKPIVDNQQLLSTNYTKDELDKVRSSSGGSKSEVESSENNSNNESNKSFTSYERLWGFPNAIATEDLLKWINDYSDELVNYAIEIAGHNNVSSYGAYKYLDTILTAWKKDNITTIEQAKKQNKEHSNRMDREFNQRRNNRGLMKKNKPYNGLDF